MRAGRDLKYAGHSGISNPNPLPPSRWKPPYLSFLSLGFNSWLAKLIGLLTSVWRSSSLLLRRSCRAQHPASPTIPQADVQEEHVPTQKMWKPQNLQTQRGTMGEGGGGGCLLQKHRTCLLNLCRLPALHSHRSLSRGSLEINTGLAPPVGSTVRVLIIPLHCYELPTSIS